MEAGKRRGDLAAHSPSRQPVRTVTGLASALGEATLPFGRGEECHTSGYLRGNGRKKHFGGKNLWEHDVFCMQHSQWAFVSVEGGQSLCRSRRMEGREGTTTCARTRVCTHTQSGLSLCYIVDYNSVKPSLYIELH